MNIGKGIKIARAKAGLRAGELAAKAGISANYLSLIENNHQVPSINVLIKLAAILETNVNELLCESEKKGGADYLGMPIPGMTNWTTESSRDSEAENAAEQKGETK